MGIEDLTLDQLVALGWTFQGPDEVTYDGETFYELRVKELPGFVVSNPEHDQVLAELNDALWTHLNAIRQAGRQPTVPENFPWQTTVPSTHVPPVIETEPQEEQQSVGLGNLITA